MLLSYIHNRRLLYMTIPGRCTVYVVCPGSHGSCVLHARRSRAPQLPEPLITAAGGPAELIALRVRAIEVLVARCCRVKRLQRRDPGDNTCSESLRCCEGLFCCLSDVLLGLVVVKDGGAILRPCGTELPIGHGRIDGVPEDVE